MSASGESASGELKRDARERLAAQRLDVPPPGAQTPEPQMTSVIRLKITDVMVYERNPRRASHERIVELKASIRANGIEQIVTVTRRPGETRYVVAKGGNSRVTAAAALYDETADERFLHYDFVYVPWPGETKLLAAHLRENDQRADLCFWDKANGYLALKADLEAERGEALSLREFARLLEQEGAPVSHVLLSLFQFATDRLSELGPATVYLSRRALVDVIQPRFGMLLRLARRLGYDDHWLQEWVINPPLANVAARCSAHDAGDPHGPAQGAPLQRAPFDAAQLVDAWRERLAVGLGVPRDALDRMCHLLERLPDTTGDELRETGGMPVEEREPERESSSIGSSVDANDQADQAEEQPQSGQVVRDRAGERAGKRGSDQHAVRDPGPVTIPGPDDVAAQAAGSGMAPADLPGAPDDDALSVGTPAGDVHGDSEPNATPPYGEGERLRETILAFAQSCGLDDCVRDAPALPYGFMVEPPPTEMSGRPRFSSDVLPDVSGRRDDVALERYLGWWWLVSLSRQNTASGLERIPADSRFAGMTRDEDTWTSICDASVGEPLLGDRMDVMFDVMLNPDRPIGQRWADLIRVARAFRAAYPDRFASPRWPEPGADERLQRGGV